MSAYIDAFVLPVPKAGLQSYKQVVEQVAEIWKEHGALDYAEYVADDCSLEGVRAFADVANATDSECVIFGWVTFESREARNLANQKVAADPRMEGLVSPLIETSPPIFDAKRMAYGGFRSLL